MNTPQQRSPEGLRTTIIDGLNNKGWFGGVSHMFDEWVGALAFVMLPDGHAHELTNLTRSLAANVVEVACAIILKECQLLAFCVCSLWCLTKIIKNKGFQKMRCSSAMHRHCVHQRVSSGLAPVPFLRAAPGGLVMLSGDGGG